MVEYLVELLSEERRDDGWRCLVAAKAMGVGGTHDGGFEQSVVAIYCHECLDDECDKAQVFLGCLARGMEQHTVVGTQTPVVVLARTVDAVEWLFVKEDAESVLACHPFHQRHQEHVVIDGEITFLVYRSQLKLVGSHLVVARLAWDGKFESLYLKVFHKGLNAVGDSAEVVVVHLLVLGTLVAHECAACEHEVGAGRVEAFIHEEIFLFPSQVTRHLCHIVIEELAYVGGGTIHGMQCAQQWSLIVEGFTGVGDEDGGDTQCVVDDEHGRCGVPG